MDKERIKVGMKMSLYNGTQDQISEDQILLILHPDLGPKYGFIDIQCLSKGIASLNIEEVKNLIIYLKGAVECHEGFKNKK